MATKPTAKLFETHDIKRADGSVPVIRTRLQYIVWKLHSNPEKADWGREGKYASQLLKKFPIIDFWKDLQPKRKFFSIWEALKPQELYYIGQDYEKYMKDKFEFQPKETFTLETEKVSEDVAIQPQATKPKSVLDFLKK